MAFFLFQCPNTGLNVQGWAAEAGESANAETYESLMRLACQQLHYLTRRPGKCLGRLMNRSCPPPVGGLPSSSWVRNRRRQARGARIRVARAGPIAVSTPSRNARDGIPHGLSQPRFGDVSTHRRDLTAWLGW